MSRNRQPLHTCGVSISEIAGKACKKVQGLAWPIGPIAKKTTKLAEPTILPLVFAIQHQWLAMLSLADNQILAVQSMIETRFPAAHQLFDKIDELVLTIETLPRKLDKEGERFPVIIHKVPFLDWALICFITWLKFLISVLTQWGSPSSSNTNEKEIVIDIINRSNPTTEINFPIPISQISQHKPETSRQGRYHVEETKGRILLPASDIPENKIVIVHSQAKPGVERCSYAEVLEKGTKKDTEVIEKPETEKGSYWEVLMKGIREETEKEEDDSLKKHSSKAVPREKVVESRGKIKHEEENKSIEYAEDEDILELFAASWHKEAWERKHKRNNAGKVRGYK